MEHDLSQKNWNQGDPILGLWWEDTIKKEALFSRETQESKIYTSTPACMYCIACSTGNTWRNTAWVFFVWTFILNPTSVDSNTKPEGGFYAGSYEGDRRSVSEDLNLHENKLWVVLLNIEIYGLTILWSSLFYGLCSHWRPCQLTK